MRAGRSVSPAFTLLVVLRDLRRRSLPRLDPPISSCLIFIPSLRAHKSVAGAEEIARQMDDSLGEIIPAVRAPCIAVGRKRAHR